MNIFCIHEKYRTGTAEFPAAILIRGVDDIYGPGKVSKLLNINRDYNGKDVLIQDQLWIEDGKAKPHEIEELPRIGIPYAAEYKDKLWRFRIKPPM